MELDFSSQESKMKGEREVRDYQNEGGVEEVGIGRQARLIRNTAGYRNSRTETTKTDGSLPSLQHAT